MKAASAVAVLLVAGLPEIAASQSVPRVVPGWGVDTVSGAWSERSWHDAVPAIYRLWRAYLTSGPEQQTPTELWSQAEQQRWRVYDHTAGTAYKGFPATVVDIRPLQPDGPDSFVIRTLFASTSGASRDVRPVALTRVHAFRENGRWVLGSALFHETRDWTQTTIGPFTFLAPPDRPLDRARARRAVAFADSLAIALGVDRLRDVTYIMADTPDALHRLMGIDWTFGGLGHGYASPGLILSGDPEFREANRHEIIHLVVQPIVQEGRSHGIVAEGVATRFGGSSGRTFTELLAEYATYLEANPAVTLDSILEANDPDRGWNPAGAVLVDMVLERRGAEGLLTLMRSGRSNDELRAAVSDLLGMPWPEIAVAWRDRVLGNRRRD